jgi:NAD(P)-dependent dehydrogenase (short-subunit alcohol dehydrogenase family)
MKTWLISGVSSGLGKALAEAVLAKGDRVVGTLRSAEQQKSFTDSHPLATGIVLDITHRELVPPAIMTIEEEVGPIDVLINNAGYGLEGTIEETTMADARHQFEVNFFGTLALTQAVLPYMRSRRAGHILTVTSIGGLISFPGVGIYNASKFALEGLSEALSKEVSGFGIRVTAIEPGMFCTDWAGRSMTRGKRTIPDYDELFNPIREARLARSGKQPGDPAKAALAIIAVVEGDEEPLHLLLGTDALGFARAKLDALTIEFQRFEKLTVSTNYD